MIAIIDYGAGNIQSVNKALKYIGCDCVVTRDKDMILKADGAVLPGVGSFGDTMDTMESYGIKDTVLDFIKTKKHFLGICLGLQLLFPESEESPNKKGLSVFDGSITKYFLTAKNPEIVAARTNYGVQIDAAIEWENVSATQFHPEKSGEVGLKILKNFADMVNGK
ncbi:MAG: imidazole glycerol phosphate synthase subunit HisH [Eubacterium sp.]|nr:imidazole glycerol phosphate synthase subunit HisH [Eubacterium sp.]